MVVLGPQAAFPLEEAFHSFLEEVPSSLVEVLLVGHPWEVAT